ncbi:carbohydrate porin [Sphingomonas sp. QA11]|uniref:carbohydrate porin n=1 Tax=Sphingomonas sp. QA11 TaxID=2950605 RepID=UPI00234AD3FE|nr:carbohydrate porin [Sphingomonas sp. QA11]WCM25897.1 carbohydrate porin [Sphingomonas sp. QA11]
MKYGSGARSLEHTARLPRSKSRKTNRQGLGVDRQGVSLLKIFAIFCALPVAFPDTPATAQVITDPTKPQPPAAPPPPKPASGPPSPFTFTAAYTADLVDTVSGGKNPGPGYIHLIKLSAAYDGNLAGHGGLSGLVSVVNLNGSTFTTSKVGGVQSISASEAQPAATRLYEAWLQQEILQGRGGVKAGFVDINTTFDVQETAALFLNASHGIGPDLSDTGRNGPSDYPTPALAMTAFYRPADGWTVQLGIFDGVAGAPDHKAAFLAVKLEGALIVGQVEKRFGDAARVEVGAWTYTASFPALDQGPAGTAPRALHGNSGLYGLVEGRLLNAPGDREGGLSGWVRIGIANGAINEIDRYLGAGLVYTGLIKGRDKDEVGIAIARAGFGSPARSAEARLGNDLGSTETDLELTYRYAFKDWLNIQPDIQYVIDPHADRHLPNALVFGLRFAFTYSK